MATANTDPGAVIESGTPLTRNHWFDGKLLRADDLARDQDYHRAALRLANQAGGFGIVNGLEVALDGAELVLQPGLAVTPDGELLLLNGELRVGVEALLTARSAIALRQGDTGAAGFQPCVLLEAGDMPAPVQAEGLRVYRLTLELSQALCGFEDVVGNLCERACVTERQRPYQLDGVRLNAQLLTLTLPALPGFDASTKHLRSRVASALFTREDTALPPLPDDGGRLKSPLWCTGADRATGRTVTLGYLVRQSSTADFVELWSGRRERMQPQAQGYWQRRMRLRPIADFVAQVAQFQCQLTRALDGAPVPAPTGGGDFDSLRAVVAELKAQIDAEAPAKAPEVAAHEGDSGLLINHATSSTLMQRLSQFSRTVAPLLLQRVDRLLLDRGIVELPPAGFLPVSTDMAPASQVQALVGPGVQLRWCSAPLDAIGHLFEEAQHSARTALTPGLADPARKPSLQVIVPDGTWHEPAPGLDVELYGAQGPHMLDLLVMLVAEIDGGQPHGPTFAATGLTDLRRLVGAAAPAATSLAGRGLGRIFSASPAGLAFGVKTDNADGKAPDGIWLECSIGADPFGAEASAPLPVKLALASLLNPMDGPVGPIGGLSFTVDRNLALDVDATQVEADRPTIEFLTGVTGGDLRGGTLQGWTRSRVHLHNVPGQPDDLEPEEASNAPLRVVLQRVREAGGIRWLVLRTYLINANGLTIVVVLDLHAPDASMARTLERHSILGVYNSNVEQGFVAKSRDSVVVARVRSDAQALAEGSVPRTQAEAAVELLSTYMPDIAPDAAARTHLFGNGDATSGMRGPHDWVLFRRPVDASCLTSPPPPKQEPTAPQVGTMRYRVGVARFLPSANEQARYKALVDMRQGQLPSEAVVRLREAGTLSYAGNALMPDVANNYLLALLGHAEFGPPCRLVGVFHRDTKLVALSERRAQLLGQTLGATPQDAVSWPHSPVNLPEGIDGLMLFAVEPDAIAPLKPPLLRGHTVWLYPDPARLKLGLGADALLKALTTADGQKVLNRMLKAGARRVPFTVKFNWGSEGNGPLSIDEETLDEFKKVMGLPGNLYDDPPTLISLDHPAANAEDHKRTSEEAQFLIAQATPGGPTSPPASHVMTSTYHSEGSLSLISDTQVLTVVLVKQ